MDKYYFCAPFEFMFQNISYMVADNDLIDVQNLIYFEVYDISDLIWERYMCRAQIQNKENHHYIV